MACMLILKKIFSNNAAIEEENACVIKEGMMGSTLVQILKENPGRQK